MHFPPSPSPSRNTTHWITSKGLHIRRHLMHEEDWTEMKLNELRRQKLKRRIFLSLNDARTGIFWHHHHHQFLNREGRWGTTDDFATSFLHFSLFSTALWDLPHSRPVYSLMLSSHLFLCLTCLLPPFTVPCWPTTGFEERPFDCSGSSAEFFPASSVPHCLYLRSFKSHNRLERNKPLCSVITFSQRKQGEGRENGERKKRHFQRCKLFYAWKRLINSVQGRGVRKLVSWCSKPSQPQRIIFRAEEDFHQEIYSWKD